MNNDYISTAPIFDCSDYLAHHGIKGQKWYVRRYQNPDGSLTEAGKRRYRKTFKEAEETAAKKRRQQSKLGLSKPTNVKAVTDQIWDAEIADKYRKLSDSRDRLHKALTEARNHGVSDAEWFNSKTGKKLENERYNANLEYELQLGRSLLKHKQDILSAKMDDLNLPRNLANDYFNYFMSSRGYNDEVKAIRNIV